MGEWVSATVNKGPFKAEQHHSGWWVVTNSDGAAIDDSGDGGFFEDSARQIAEALNSTLPKEQRNSIGWVIVAVAERRTKHGYGTNVKLYKSEAVAKRYANGGEVREIFM